MEKPSIIHREDLTPSQKILYLHLKELSLEYDSEQFVISHADLCDRTKMSSRTLSTGIARLKDKRLLEIKSRGSLIGRGRSENCYKIK